MALMGTGVLANWGGVLPDKEADYNAWHSLEHMEERLAVPGFLRGRRGVLSDPGDPADRYFMMYEVETPRTLVSEPYLARLNDPTPWTAGILAAYLAPSRTVCRVTATTGRGVGGWCGTVTSESRLPGAAGSTAIHAVAGLPGVVGAHALEGEAELGQAPTAEKRLRESQGKSDATVAAAFLVEGYDRDLVRLALDRLVETLTAQARSVAFSVRLYSIQHIVCVQD